MPTIKDLANAWKETIFFKRRKKKKEKTLKYWEITQNKHKKDGKLRT